MVAPWVWDWYVVEDKPTEFHASTVTLHVHV